MLGKMGDSIFIWIAAAFLAVSFLPIAIRNEVLAPGWRGHF